MPPFTPNPRLFRMYRRIAYPDMPYHSYLAFLLLAISELLLERDGRNDRCARNSVAHGLPLKNVFSKEQTEYMNQQTEWYAPLARGTLRRLSEWQKIRLREIQYWLLTHRGPRNKVITLKVIKDWFKNKRRSLRNTPHAKPDSNRPNISFLTKPRFKKRRPRSSRPT